MNVTCQTQPVSTAFGALCQLGKTTGGYGIGDPAAQPTSLVWEAFYAMLHWCNILRHGTGLGFHKSDFNGVLLEVMRSSSIRNQYCQEACCGGEAIPFDVSHCYLDLQGYHVVLYIYIVSVHIVVKET